MAIAKMGLDRPLPTGAGEAHVGNSELPAISKLLSQYWETQWSERLQLIMKQFPSSDSGEGTPRAKGGKLARRARSFKEDFLDILAQMRSPAGARSGSPKPSPKHRTTSGSEPPAELERNPLRDLDLHVRQFLYNNNLASLLPDPSLLSTFQISALFTLQQSSLHTFARALGKVRAQLEGIVCDAEAVCEGVQGHFPSVRCYVFV
ncbi:Rap guanine nucleotide exchange factor 1 [Homalodisca vitripennis]|nr:Rap guanine nucleotide exchange factor 1 [Homalodisca vitripennis]